MEDEVLLREQHGARENGLMPHQRGDLIASST